MIFLEHGSPKFPLGITQDPDPMRKVPDVYSVDPGGVGCSEPDDPGTWEASYRPLAVEGQRAVAEGTTSYTNGDFFWNIWTLRFDEENRCSEFVEWFMVRPRD